jgi:hypothetical protein
MLSLLIREREGRKESANNPRAEAEVSGRWGGEAGGGRSRGGKDEGERKKGRERGAGGGTIRKVKESVNIRHREIAERLREGRGGG